MVHRSQDENAQLGLPGFGADPDEQQKRDLIDQLIADTHLYSTRAQLKELFDFTAGLRKVAPFNAMLLNMQKPGITYVATRKDWALRHERIAKPHARPMVILRNFGPVDFVYDVLDVKPPLPEDVYQFPAGGTIPEGWFPGAITRLARQAIDMVEVDQGDSRAGQVRMTENLGDPKQLNRFEVLLNRNHPPTTRFVTLAHELGHLYLGHCGPDLKRGVKARRPVDLAVREVEAESVAYLLAKRSGISPRSESYLDRYRGAFEDLDLHSVMHACGQVERLLSLPLHIPGEPLDD
jgi:hypothetical protein